MKKLSSIIAALLLSLSLQAADEPASAYSVSSDFTYTTQYFFRGVKNQEQAFQPSVTLTSGNWTTGVWTSQALNKKAASWAQGKEYDFFGSYNYAINEKYSLTVGGTYYYYPSARPSRDEAKNSTELNVAVAGPVGPLAGKITAFRDFDFKSTTFQLDLGYSMPLADKRVSLDFGGYFGTTNIGDVNADRPGTGRYDYRYYGLDTSVSYKLSDHATAKLGVHWTDVSGLPTPDDNVWVSVGVSMNF